MIELVRRQPRLVSLDVNDLYLNDIQADLSISPCAEHEPVTPFNTRIEELSIAIQGGPDMSEQMAPMLKFLLIKIPTLTRFDGPHVSQQAMKDFVGKYVQWYPHLANTKLNMWCWQESI
ncbi:hypothetical protein H4R19_000350 [Coemansia spiralis]|nr:hypothetical protein H4R19_000350 [Coemansia spiralis]